MIIIAGYSLAKNVEERDAAVAAFAEMVGRARKQDGCIDMAITADSLDPTRSNIIEIWRDEQAWKAWRKVARGPRSRAQEIHVSLYRSDKVETLAQTEHGFRPLESPAITGYFARKLGPTPLAPEKSRARALCDQWLSWQATELSGGWGYAVMALARKVPGYDNEAKMRILEARMTKSRFVAGEAMTMADIAVSLAVHRWFSVDRELEPMPHAGAYLERLRGESRGGQYLTEKTP